MIETLPPALRRAVSPYVGIVRSVEECLHAAAEPPIFQAACSLGSRAGVTGSTLAHLSGIGGAGRTRAAAAAAAAGEAIERYSATQVPPERLVVASARELGDVAVQPERFALFSDSQYSSPGFPYRRFTSDARVAWVEGRELRSGRAALLPAEVVFLGRARDEEVAPIAYSTSNGLACGETRAETIVAALCELLERDAFMVVWANRLTLPLLDPGSACAVSADAELFSRAGLRFAAVDLSPLHRLPSVLGVVRAPAGVGGALGVGAGTAPTVERAWWKALAEAFASRAAGAKLALLGAGRPFGLGGAGIVSFDDHIRYYADHANVPATRFLDAAVERRPLGSVPPLEGGGPSGWIRALCERVEAAGSTAYAVDVTSPDVRSLGLAVTRVLAPELCPLDAPHGARFLGGRRLYEAAAAGGLRAEPLRESDVNPDPHPFP